MLSPSKLFFGTPDPEPPPDEKPPVRSGVAADTWQDSDADERTDVPAEQSLEASLNESEEERRSPAGGVSTAVGDELAPAVVVQPQPHRAPLALQQSPGQRPPPPGQRPPLPDRPPPGLPLLGTGELRGPALVRPLPDDAAADLDDSDEDEEDADDERSHLNGERRAGAVAGALEGQGLTGDISELRFSELPSIGSANHFSGSCDRCCFHPKGRCLNGFNCQHCHFDHEKRKRKNKKKNKKQIQPLGCDEAMEILSVSADGSSLPVSPDQPFGPGLLPQADGFAASPATTPSGAVAGCYLSQQPPPFFAPAASRAPASALAAGSSEGKWLQAASPPQQCAGAPPPAVGPSGFEFSGQLPSTMLGPGADAAYAQRLELEARYAGESDRREDYVRRLEAENRYLRSLLAQCMGPGATSTAAPPPRTPSAQSLQAPSSLLPFLRSPDSLAVLPPPEGSDNTVAPQLAPYGPCPPPPPLPPPSVPSAMPPAKSGVPPGVAPMLPPHTGGSQALSPSAPPFWPVGQAWHDAGDLDVGQYDVSSHGVCPEQITSSAVALLRQASNPSRDEMSPSVVPGS